MTDTAKPIPDGYHTVTPYLVVDDASAILSFIERAFGGTVLSRHHAPDGRVMHAEAQIGDSRVMLGEASSEWPGMPMMLHLYVEDVDAVYRRALEAGAASVREPQDMFYGDRTSGVRDAAGNQWWITTHIEDVSAEEMARRHAAHEAGSDG